MKNYFSLEELIKTDTGLLNEPNFLTQPNFFALRTLLNIVRHEIDLPIIVNSAFRSDEVNKAVGGAENSKHLSFLAADVKCSNMSKLNKVLRHYKAIGVLTELIEHPTFTHLAL